MKVLEKKLVVEEVEQVLDPECVNIEDSYIPNPTSMVPTFDNLTEYSFETDNLALKNNTDYYKLLRTLSILEGQRNLVVSNLEKLSELLENSQKNPLEQVDLLKKGEFFSPPRVEITELPVVDWSKYGVNVPEFILEAKPTFSQNSQNDTQIKNINGRMVVRGRIFDESKPVTFNQHWKPEEQRLLEELLEKFPPEPIEYQRCKKIAAAMGNRTARQVLSRVQKYFIKLQKAGLPVPGRKYGYEKYLKRNKKFNAEAQRLRHLFMPSTFWGSSGLTVSMNDDDSSSSSLKENKLEPDLFKMQDQQGTRSEDEISDISDEEDIPVELRNTPEYEEIQWLKFVMKIEKKQSYLGLVVHDSYRCDKCGVEPIKGTRWQCSQCIEDASVDFCNNCARDRPSIKKHLKSHQLFPIMRLDES